MSGDYMSITNVIQINTNTVGVQQGDLNSIQISSSLEHSQDDLKSPQSVTQIFQIPWVIIEKSLPSVKRTIKLFFMLTKLKSELSID